ncbi:MAG: hypothetical protein PHF86_10835, partial [Candidatus Nanoarchaeia archaeon]|nr:hypothetical protein [Candidatus Nanoarchaeia archaeon]
IKDPILQKKISLLIKSKEENLYLVINSEITAYKINNMKSKNNIQCKSNPSSLHLVFENKGDYTELEIK